MSLTTFFRERQRVARAESPMAFLRNKSERGNEPELFDYKRGLCRRRSLFRSAYQRFRQCHELGGATLTVTNGAPIITNQPQSQAVVAGQDATFTVGASGSGTLWYQWRFNGTNISTATGTSYTRAAAQLSDAGDYFGGGQQIRPGRRRV